MRAIGEIKYCPICKKNLSTNEYGKDRKYPDGLKVYCKSCRKEKEKEYYYNNLEKNRENAKLRQRKFRENPENAEKWRQFAKDAYHQNPKFHIERRKKWRHSENGRTKMLLQLQRRRSAITSVYNDLSQKDVLFLLEFQNNLCPKCKRSFLVVPYTIDHIIPVSLGGATTLQNIQLLCRRCNSSKKDKTILYRQPIDFLGGTQ